MNLKVEYKKFPGRKWCLILLFASVDLIIHLLTNTRYDLHRDEYLYVAMKDHLDFGFMTVPPFIGIIAKFSHFLFGHTVSGYRFFPSFAGSLTVILIGMTVVELGGRWFAITLASLSYIISGIYLHINFMLQPVSFDVLFWTLALYLSVRLIHRQDPKMWIWLGIVLGLAFQNKYLVALLYIGIPAGILFTGNRKLIWSRYFLYGCLAGFLILLPVMIWQYRHNFPVVHHMVELQKHQLVHVSVVQFLLDQLIINLNSIYVVIYGLIVLFFYKKEARYRYLGWTFLLVMLMLILSKGKNYYSAGLYPVMFAFGAYALEKYTFPLKGPASGNGQPVIRKAAFGYRKVLSQLLLLIPVFLFLPMLPYSLPVLKPEKMVSFCKRTAKSIGYVPVRWEDGKVHELPQDWADMIGWRELGSIVTRTYQGMGQSDRKGCTIYAENYGQAAAIAYYGKPKGLPEPVCFIESFLFWAPDNLKTGSLIYVNEDPTEMKIFFDSVKEVGRIENPYSRESGLPVFLCTGPHSDFGPFYTKKVRKLKNEYRRD